jgi:dTDP-L-rhamnose 4-epimerase
MRVLVTGGAGFVGCATTWELVRRGHYVTILDSLEPQVHGIEQLMPAELEPLVRSGSVEFIHGRVEDMSLLQRLLARADAVIHLAALVGVGQSTYEARRYAESNTVAVAALSEAIVRGRTAVQRVVTASSISNYGEGAGINPRIGCLVAPIRRRQDLQSGRWDPIDPDDEQLVEIAPTPETFPQRPTSMYGLTKRFTEDTIRLLGEATGVSVACLRYGNLYGPGQALSNPYSGVLCSFFTRLRAKKPPLLFEDGEQQRCYTFVEDVAHANVLALERDFPEPTCLNISSSQAVSLKALCAEVVTRMGQDVEPTLLGIARIGDVRHMLPDPSCAAIKLGFYARTPLTDGLARWLEAANAESPIDHTDKALSSLLERGLLLGPKVADFHL